MYLFECFTFKISTHHIYPYTPQNYIITKKELLLKIGPYEPQNGQKLWCQKLG
jgi:hypothetical protein